MFTQFIETFGQLQENKYIGIENNKYKVLDHKSNKFKTDQIIEVINQSLKEIRTYENEPFSTRIALLKKLDGALNNYNQRISKWITSRWWYCIAKCFGYPQCPKKLLNVKAAVEKTIKALNIKAENKKLDDQYELMKRISKEIKEIINYKNKLRRKVFFKWRQFTAISKRKKLHKKLDDDLEIAKKKNASEMAQLEDDDLEIAKKKNASEMAQLEKEQNELNQKKQEFLELRKRWEDAIAKNNPIQKPLTEYPTNAWKSLKENSDLPAHICSFLSDKDLSSLSTVGKGENVIARDEFDFRKQAKDLVLTKEEIEIGQSCGKSFLQRLIFENSSSKEFKLLEEWLEVIDEAVVTQADTIDVLRTRVLKYWNATEEGIEKSLESEDSFHKLLLKKWGFTDEEITLTSQSENGLKKLVRETREAERLVKFCRFLPKNLLNEIVKQHLPHLNPELKPRIIHFNFLEKHSTEFDEEGDPIIIDIPIIGGKDLLKIAEEVRNFMKSEEGQKIQQLKIQLSASSYWHIKTATQLDSLPISINLLKGLRHLEILDHDGRRFKKLPPICLPNLKELIIRATDISELPYMDLPELTDCELSCNSFIDVPHFKGNLPKLLNLDLRAREDYFIKYWRDVELPISLRTLSISNSKIRHLPISIGKLKNLTELGIFQNNDKQPRYFDLLRGPIFDESYKQREIEKYKHSIDKIPPEIALLENLQVLSLANCNINKRTDGFEWISLLPNLKQFTYRDY